MMSGIGNIGKFGGDLILNKLNKPWFAIKKGVLYQYKKKTARDCDDKFLIHQISAVAMIKAKFPSDDDVLDNIGVLGNKQQAQFQMIYQNVIFVYI